MDSNVTTIKSCSVVLEPLTPQNHADFARELKKAILERNMLTAKTRRKVVNDLDEMRLEEEEKRNKIKRENTVAEIISSEETYVKQLETIIKYFMKPSKEQKLLRSYEFETLFENIVVIYNISEKLLQKLKSESCTVAEAFTIVGPYFKLYSTYAGQFKHILKILQIAKIQNPKFYKFTTEQETRPEVQNKLSALMITPIQRIPRYRLLLQQLLDLTSPSDQEFCSLLDSLQRVKEAADHIDKTLQEQEHIQRLLEVQRCFKNSQPNIITPGRTLLKEGILKKIGNKVGVGIKLYVILTNDIILFCKMKKDQIKVNSLECEQIFPLKKCKVETMLNKGCFKIVCEQEEIYLYKSELSVVKEWVEEIKEAIAKINRDSKTLRKESSARRPAKRKDLIVEYHEIGLSPGKPLQKRRRMSQDEEGTKSSKFLLSGRRTFRSQNIERDDLTLTPKTKHDQLHSRVLVSNELRNSEIDQKLNESGRRDEPESKQVYIFGAPQNNTSFNFKLGNMFKNLGCSVANLLSFRKKV